MTDNIEPPLDEEPVEVAQEALSAPLEPSEPVVEETPAPKKKSAPKASEMPDFIRAEAGDSYLSIAYRYLPEGKAVGVFSAELVRLNLKRPVREGVKIYLKENK